MNSLDFYLALLFGCKRDVALVAVKVGGLTDCVFTGLCGALPEAKGKGGGAQGAYSKVNSGMKKVTLFLVVATMFAAFSVARGTSVATPTVDGVMTMTTAGTHWMVIPLLGSGIATIDWGDEIIDTVFLIKDKWFEVERHFDADQQNPRTITIKGKNIIGMYSHRNVLTALDVSRNNKLIKLWCQENQLTVLDISKNSQLQVLYCENNQLNALDLSQNVELVELWCANNQLTSLDVSHNKILEILGCEANLFTADALNALFDALKDNGKETQTIDIRNNPGTADCDVGIAEAKGWIVIH